MGKAALAPSLVKLAAESGRNRERAALGFVSFHGQIHFRCPRIAQYDLKFRSNGFFQKFR
jgi:hypothetical protein